MKWFVWMALSGLVRSFRPDVFVWIDSCAVESYSIERMASVRVSQIGMYSNGERKRKCN